MPYSRLQYNWDSQYTTKDKRNLLLTQEVIQKINNIMPGTALDAVVETDSYSPMSWTQLKELWDTEDIVFELNQAPFTYLYSLVDEELVYDDNWFTFISEDWWVTEWKDSNQQWLEFGNSGVWYADWWGSAV